jgi:hypothetical protein
MTKHTLIPAGLVIGMGLMLVTVTAQQQPTKAPAPAASTAPAATKAPAPAAAKAATPAYKQPMTSWGEPDISGMWPINHLVTSRLPVPRILEIDFT